MKNLNMRVHIEPAFTAEQWQLFTASMDCKNVAEKLNYELKIVVNGDSMSRAQIEQHMHQWMRKFAEYGAYDSEPIWFLQQVLDEIYGG